MLTDFDALAMRYVLEERALWHLELLGCYEPSDAEPPAPQIEDHERYEDDYDDDLGCTHCVGEGFAEDNDPFWDDCDEFGWGPCKACRGTGERRHQWVF